MNRDKLWQLLDEQGQPLPNTDKDRHAVLSQALLHGASHVWLWRKQGSNVELLLQKRASDKKTWPDYYDVSAAGHIDVGEEPLEAALRETQEEIALELKPEDLKLAGVNRAYVPVENSNYIENELQWVYVAELQGDVTFELQEAEVSLLEWRSLAIVKQEYGNPVHKYVPHRDAYFAMVFAEVERRMA